MLESQYRTLSTSSSDDEDNSADSADSDCTDNSYQSNGLANALFHFVRNLNLPWILYFINSFPHATSIAVGGACVAVSNEPRCHYPEKGDVQSKSSSGFSAKFKLAFLLIFGVSFLGHLDIQWGILWANTQGKKQKKLNKWSRVTHFVIPQLYVFARSILFVTNIVVTFIPSIPSQAIAGIGIGMLIFPSNAVEASIPLLTFNFSSVRESLSYLQPMLRSVLNCLSRLQRMGRSVLDRFSFIQQRGLNDQGVRSRLLQGASGAARSSLPTHVIIISNFISAILHVGLITYESLLADKVNFKTDWSGLRYGVLGAVPFSVWYFMYFLNVVTTQFEKWGEFVLDSPVGGAHEPNESRGDDLTSNTLDSPNKQCRRRWLFFLTAGIAAGYWGLIAYITSSLSLKIALGSEERTNVPQIIIAVLAAANIFHNFYMALKPAPASAAAGSEHPSASDEEERRHAMA